MNSFFIFCLLSNKILFFTDNTIALLFTSSGRIAKGPSLQNICLAILLSVLLCFIIVVIAD